jgi:hypothetical protein
LAGAKAERIAKGRSDGVIVLCWSRKDPDFNALLTAVRGFAGRRWDSVKKQWAVPVTGDNAEALAAFLDEWDINCDEAARALLTPAAVAAVAAVVAATPLCSLSLEGSSVRWGKVDVDRKGGWDLVAAIKALPGRRYDGRTQTNTCDISTKVLDVADEYNITVPQNVADAIEVRAQGTKAEDAQKALMVAASRAESPDALPESFLALVAAARVA